MANIFSTLVPIEQQGERVLTTAQLAEFYGCDERRISENFNRNAEHFMMGKHYFKVDGEDLQKLRYANSVLQISPMTRVLYLWTKRGTYRHAKMLGTERAWDVFEMLEENYFSPKAQVPMSNDEIMSRALVLAHETLARIAKEKEALKEQVAIQAQQITELKPKATYYDLVLSCKNAVPITVIAKDYGKSGIWLNAFLHEQVVQYKMGGTWLLYQKYAECGYTRTKTFTPKDSGDDSQAYVHTYWTQKGRLFIYELLKHKGILPRIELEENAPASLCG